jgi:hypothetical protein
MILLLNLGVAAVVAQEGAEPPTAADAAEDEAAADEQDDDIEPVIREGVFTPSERIEADSEISFPADI